MFSKLAYLPSKPHFSSKYLFQEHEISAGQLSADSSSTEILYCLITIYHSLHVYHYHGVIFLMFQTLITIIQIL